VEARLPGQEEAIIVCAIGASAGGVAALSQLFATLPGNLGLAYVVVTHLDPDHPSQLREILAHRTPMGIEEVGPEATIRADHIYLISPDSELVIDGNRLLARPFHQPRGHRAPIDIFFRSLAAGRGDGLAVVLSGAGSDGAVGVRAVKEAGGVVFVQEPSTAEFPLMPRSAMATGVADFVGPIEELADRIAEVVRSRRAAQSLEADDVDGEVRTILRILRARTGHDFSSYKRATILRRIARRMQVMRQQSLDDYEAVLRRDADETERLFNDLLISVTLFFRDPAAFATLAEEVVPRLFDTLEDDQPLRVWAIGCATGEEAYSLAMLLIEEAGRRPMPSPIQVFATDLDDNALRTAREGRYPASIEADVSDERLQRFFVKEGEFYRIRQELRDLVLFANHNVLKDPPFTRLHLISCRNLLIYLDRELQRELTSLFHYALVPNGFLFLGSAESVDAPELFSGFQREARILQARARADRTLPNLPQLPTEPIRRAGEDDRGVLAEPRESTTLVHAETLEDHAPPSALVDSSGHVLALSDTAGRFLLHSRGRLHTQLAAIVRPELRFDVDRALRRAFEDGERTLTLPVAVAFNGAERRVLMQVSPLREPGSRRPERALVFFLEGGEAEAGLEEEVVEPAAGEQVRRLKDELRNAYERLSQSRREHEDSVQALRAANEELQSINEEYRSTSEELETSKEELQSINEELQTVNAELKSKLETISSAHSDLENLMAAAEIATLFLDGELRIRLFTPKLTQLFNIAEADRGRAITDFTHKLENEEVDRDGREVLRDLIPREREVKSRDGAWLLMRIRPYRTIDDRIDGVVVSFVDLTARREAEERLRRSEARLKAILDATGIVAFEWNSADDELFEEGPVAAVLRVGPATRHQTARALVARAVEGDRERVEAELERAGAGEESVAVEFRVRDHRGEMCWLRLRGGHAPGWPSARVLGVIQDVTDEKAAEERQALLLRELNHRVKNTLAVVLSILYQTRRSSASLDAFADSFVARIHALADAHDLLTRTQWQGAGLDELVRIAVASYTDGQRRRVELGGPHVEVAPATAISLAMALHELATNALKYGALSTEQGKVDVNWHEEPADADGPARVVLTWVERGGPPVAPPAHKGFGSLLLERGAAHEVGGSSSLAFEPEGVTCTISLPVHREDPTGDG